MSSEIPQPYLVKMILAEKNHPSLPTYVYVLRSQLAGLVDSYVFLEKINSFQQRDYDIHVEMIKLLKAQNALLEKKLKKIKQKQMNQSFVHFKDDSESFD